MRTHSMIITLCGDYIWPRGGQIWSGSLIKVLENFGLSEQAVRSALSRMCRKGWLTVERAGKNSYYSLTEEGKTLLTKGAQRIFERKDGRWDGTWHLVTYSIPEERREVRDRLRQELSWMGYGLLSNATWISPYNSAKEVEELAERSQIKDHLEIFQAKHQGFATSAALAARCWDLERIHQRYEAFVTKYKPRLEEHLRRLHDGDPVTLRECFVERFMLIHEYRRFPFFDPELPAELLPSGWLRPQAAALFREYHNLLAEKANAYFDSIFEESARLRLQNQHSKRR